MKPKKTMSVAQKLYEGVDLGGGGGRVGLITYMRTDSTRLSDEAMQNAEEWIFDNFGKDYLANRKSTATKSKGNVQDAHEAIRPTDLKITPKKARSILDVEAANLYEMIYRRFIASQMADALFDQTVVELRGGAFLFRSTGRVPTFRGWLQVYDDEPVDDKNSGDSNSKKGRRKGSGNDEREEEEEQQRVLPTGLREGVPVDLVKIDKKKSETKPQPHYSESTLVKELEAKGIGRPSTYAQTVGTILERGYVREEGRRLYATELGIRVSDTLTGSFPDLFDVRFTARMEKDLDTIATGKATYLKVMQGFYKPFSSAIKRARIGPATESERRERGGPVKLRRGAAKKEKARLASRSEAISGEATIPCSKCSSAMELREGKYGPYYACTGFPKCSNLIPASEVSAGALAEGGDTMKDGVASGEGTCPECGSLMVRRSGKNGEFLGCSTFPNCRRTSPIPSDHPCPVCGTGDLVERRTKKTGTSFWGCSRYPDCRFTTESLPESK
jgi:DNA topoisomerase-1